VSSLPRRPADGVRQSQPVQTSLSDAILATLAGGTALVGTPRVLARGFRISTATLRASLRDLLERGEIAMHSGPGGQVTIRRGLPDVSVLPPLAPPVPRRSSRRTVWIVPQDPSPVLERQPHEA
jgi:DNA-binding GntR family transcriptional regulator